MKNNEFKMVKSLKDNGYSWAEIAGIFEEEFGISYKPDALRMKFKRHISSGGKTYKPQLRKTPGMSVKSKFHGGKKVSNALIIPDCHIPYHDKKAYDLMLNSAIATYGANNIHEVVILGDYADFYAINSHGKEASMSGAKLKKEVAAVNKELDRLDQLFPNAKKVFIQGNHEYRLERYIDRQCPELFGIVGTEELFRLKERGWHYVPYGPTQLYQILGSRLYARHEPYAGGVHVAHGTVVKAGCSVIFGHTHRIQEAQVVMANGENHRGISCGWLGDKNSKVMQYVKSHHQWCLGFSVCSVLPDGTFFNNIIHIINHKCAIAGKVYHG